MLRHIEIVVMGLIFGFVSLPARAETAPPVAVVCAKDAPFAEKLAAKEVRRYVYLRTGSCCRSCMMRNRERMVV